GLQGVDGRVRRAVGIEPGMEEGVHRLCQLPPRPEPVVPLHGSAVRPLHAVRQALMWLSPAGPDEGRRVDSTAFMRASPCEALLFCTERVAHDGPPPFMLTFDLQSSAPCFGVHRVFPRGTGARWMPSGKTLSGS